MSLIYYFYLHQTNASCRLLVHWASFVTVLIFTKPLLRTSFWPDFVIYPKTAILNSNIRLGTVPSICTSCLWTTPDQVVYYFCTSEKYNVSRFKCASHSEFVRCDSSKWCCFFGRCTCAAIFFCFHRAQQFSEFSSARRHVVCVYYGNV